MKLHPVITRLIVLAFFGLIGYCLASSIAVGSVMGIVLAIVSLGATIVFLYYLPKLHEQQHTTEEEQA